MSASAPELRWKYSLNAGQIFGHKPPAATLPRRNHEVSLQVKDCVPFERTEYMSCQTSGRARKEYLRYVRRMIGLIQLPQLSETADPAGAQPMRFVGVVTQLNDPHASSGNDRNAPWEFYPIPESPDGDDDCDALQSLLDGLNPAKHSEIAGEAQPRHALLLYCGQVTRFSMMHPGSVVGVVGLPLRRDVDGRLSALQVQQIILPSKPRVPWSLPVAATSNAESDDAVRLSRAPLRVMTCFGPYPRRAVRGILSTLLELAVQRQVSCVVVTGPFVPIIEEHERSAMAHMQKTFEADLVDIVVMLETVLTSLSATNAAARHLHVVVVPSIDDASVVPVLPQVKYTVESSVRVVTATNPCCVTVDGVQFGILNYDVVSEMRERMVERMQGLEEGSLHRVAQAVVLSRLYTPLFEFPLSYVDSSHLSSLRIDGGTAAVQTGGSDGGDGNVPAGSISSINGNQPESSQPPQPPVEHIPHFLFLPSVKPAFAFGTHAYGQDISDAVGLGSVVINPMVWSQQRRQPYFLNVVEITVPSPATLIQRGPSAEESAVSAVVFSAYRE